MYFFFQKIKQLKWNICKSSNKFVDLFVNYMHDPHSRIFIHSTNEERFL